ncbi:hypothetical protein [Candidatus Methylomirabilis sp.]|nr:hypothetical protein [Candidatus Methylomirabilis sp.]
MTYGVRTLTIPHHNPVNAYTMAVSCATPDCRKMNSADFYETPAV